LGFAASAPLTVTHWFASGTAPSVVTTRPTGCASTAQQLITNRVRVNVPSAPGTTNPVSCTRLPTRELVSVVCRMSAAQSFTP
jgi:hypothetical protein